MPSPVCRRQHRFVLGADDAELFLEGVEPEPWEPDEEAVGTINYTERHHRPAQGGPAHPPEPVAERDRCSGGEPG